MRILQVIHAFPPDSLAGAEVFARGLSLELVRAGHHVTVLHRVADPARAEYDLERTDRQGLTVIRLNHTLREQDRFERTYRSEAIDRRFQEVLEQERPDVVHFHHVTNLSTNLVAVAHRHGSPVVFTLHDYWLICQRGQFLKPDLSRCPGQEDRECARCLAGPLQRGAGGARARALLRRVPAAGLVKRLLGRPYRAYAGRRAVASDEALAAVAARMAHVREMCALVDRFVAPSRFLKERFVEFGVPAERILHATPGFETTLFGRPRPSHREGLRFGYLGACIPPKGVDVLLEAFRGLTDTRATLEIHGHQVPYEGHEGYGGRLRRLARAPRISLLGPYDNRDVGRILAGLDVLVVPSIWWENSPLTIQEAFAAGVPVVASDLGGIPELVRDGANGLLFPAGDVAALRDRMDRLVREPELLRRLRPDPRRVKTLRASVAEHEALYRGLARSRTAGSPAGS